MTTIFIAVILITGYVYVNLCLDARYKFKRLEGWSVYFFVAAWGAVFVCIAWLLCTFLSVTGILRGVLNSLFAFFDIKYTILHRVFPISFNNGNELKDMKSALWGVVSVLLAWIFGVIKSGWAGNEDRRLDALARVVLNNPLESFLMEAAVTQTPVMITLSSRKFYVGMVFCPSFENGDVKHIEFLPLLSGYREEDALITHVTTNYRRHYKSQGITSTPLGGLTLSDFRKLISKDDIDSLSFFEAGTYSNFKKMEKIDREQGPSLNGNFQSDL